MLSLRQKLKAALGIATYVSDLEFVNKSKAPVISDLVVYLFKMNLNDKEQTLTHVPVTAIDALLKDEKSLLLYIGQHCPEFNWLTLDAKKVIGVLKNGQEIVFR